MMWRRPCRNPNHPQRCRVIRSYRTECPICRDEVVYYSCTSGSRVFLDPGPTLTRHGCMPEPSRARKRRPFPASKSSIGRRRCPWCGKSYGRRQYERHIRSKTACKRHHCARGDLTSTPARDGTPAVSTTSSWVTPPAPVRPWRGSRWNRSTGRVWHTRALGTSKPAAGSPASCMVCHRWCRQRNPSGDQIARLDHHGRSPPPAISPARAPACSRRRACTCSAP